MARAHRIHHADDIATALDDIRCGEVVQIGDVTVTATADIPRGHKMALRPIASGATVAKFGWPIGSATAAISVGDHVHSHNLVTLLGSATERLETADDLAGAGSISRNFAGYRRSNGRVGTRNEIWILCTVGCVANTARRIADAAGKQFAGQVDGVFAFPHPFGCSQLGDDLSGTRRLLASLAAHPNAGGVLIVGLGCESNQLDALLAEAPGIDRTRLRAFTAQMVEDEVEEGIAAVAELVAVAAQDRRTTCSLADLVIGLKCGGSDGFSGITANPLVGHIADSVTKGGGAAILTEIPEIFGAEHILIARARDSGVADRIGALVDRFKRYFTDHGEPVSENPSPGNKAGGITTLEEKSLGAVQKAGTAPVADVIDYGCRVDRRGLTLLEAPGNDAVSSTALAAAGATVILFTTGRGTPLGFPVPTMKISSNTALARRKPGWIDFDAGTILDGEAMLSAGVRLLDTVVAVAGGAPTCAEINGEREIAIWKRGVTL
jgi:altronate hydrolase